MGQPLILGWKAKTGLWPLCVLKLQGLNYTHERLLHAKDEVCRPNNFWIIDFNLMISSLLASDSVGMIYLRSNIDDNLIWLLSVHVWHSEGARSETYWFGLYRGCVTLTWPKLNISAQKHPSCKISGHFVHWGPFYGTPLPKNPDFAPPLSLSTWWC